MCFSSFALFLSPWGLHLGPCGALWSSAMHCGEQGINQRWSKRRRRGWQGCPALPPCFPQSLTQFSGFLNLFWGIITLKAPPLRSTRVMDGPDTYVQTYIKTECRRDSHVLYYIQTQVKKTSCKTVFKRERVRICLRESHCWGGGVQTG